MLAQHKVWLVFRDKVLKAQQNDGEVEKVRNKMKWGVETPFPVLKDRMLTMGKMMYLFNDKAFKEEILKQAHESRFVVHPGSTKMYKDLKELYWWPNMKKRIEKYMARCGIYQPVKVEH